MEIDLPLIDTGKGEQLLSQTSQDLKFLHLEEAITSHRNQTKDWQQTNSLFLICRRRNHTKQYKIVFYQRKERKTTIFIKKKCQ